MQVPHRPGEVWFSIHAFDERLHERDLTMGEVYAVIGAGRIYEQKNGAPVTYWGMTDDGRPLGVVVDLRGKDRHPACQPKGGLAMKNPATVEVDLLSHYARVRFREVLQGEKIGSVLLEDPNGDDLDVVVERTPAGEIVGIEILGFDPRVIAAAESFACENGFMFPAQAFERFTAALTAA